MQGTIRDMDVFGDDYRIVKNPTKRELAQMAEHYYQEGIRFAKDLEGDANVAEDQHVRTLYDPADRTLYAWGALHNSHDYVAEVLSLSDYEKGCVVYDPETGISKFHTYNYPGEKRHLPDWSLKV